MDRRKFLQLSTAVGAGGTMLGLAASATAAPVLAISDEDRQLNEIQAALEALPEDLKNADPATTPNYERRLTAALGGLTVVTSTSVTSGNTAAFNVGKCALEVAGLVIQYGIPVAKIISWIRKARALWGGVSGILRAIRSGVAATQIGGEAATVLGSLLGIDSVVKACFR